MIKDFPAWRKAPQFHEPQPRNWLRFRLRTFLIAVVLLGMILGWVGREWQKERQQAILAQSCTVGWSLADESDPRPGSASFFYSAVGRPDGFPNIVFFSIKAPGYSKRKYQIRQVPDGRWLGLEYSYFEGFPHTFTAKEITHFDLWVVAPSGNLFEVPQHGPPDPIFFKEANPTHQELLDYWKNKIEPLFKKYPQREWTL